MSRASAALDGDPSTAWTTPLVGVTGQWWEVELAQPTTLSELQIELVADDHHSLPTRLDVVVDGGEPTSVAVPPVERGELGPTRSVAVPLPRELTGKIGRAPGRESACQYV